MALVYNSSGAEYVNSYCKCPALAHEAHLFSIAANPILQGLYFGTLEPMSLKGMAAYNNLLFGLDAESVCCCR